MQTAKQDQWHWHYPCQPGSCWNCFSNPCIQTTGPLQIPEVVDWLDLPDAFPATHFPPFRRKYMYYVPFTFKNIRGWKSEPSFLSLNCCLVLALAFLAYCPLRTRSRLEALNGKKNNTKRRHSGPISAIFRSRNLLHQLTFCPFSPSVEVEAS